MQAGELYFKAEAGRQEMQDRGHRLPASLRSLLLMVDGQRDQSQLRALMTGLHAPADGLEQLVVLGLVRRNEPPSAAALAPLPGAAAMPVEFGRYRRLYEIVTDSIRIHPGLRGYSVQLKVEQCADVDALLALLPEIATALTKASDHTFASVWLAGKRAEVQA